MSQRLRVNEIFVSLQGESRSVGWPTVFVRLTGCPLRCRYCDTAYAFKGGSHMHVDEVFRQVATFGLSHVTVTGGEPLAQTASLFLLRTLCEHGYEVSLETSGALDIGQVDPRVSIVMDIKTPGSGEVDKNLWSNLDKLRSQDQLKFVLLNRADYLWAKRVLTEKQLWGRCEILFSPVHGQLPPQHLADWIVEDRLAVRFQIQLHKMLWGEQRGR